MKKLRVLLVDDEIMVREGFKRLFDWEAHDCQVIGEAADGMEALAKIDTLCPDGYKHTDHEWAEGHTAGTDQASRNGLCHRFRL